MGNKCTFKVICSACCNKGVVSDHNGMQIDEKSSKIISLHIDSAKSNDLDRKDWPSCDFSNLLKIGTVCFMNNQKDLQEGKTLNNIRSNNKM